MIICRLQHNLIRSALAGLIEYGPGGVYERNPASLGFQFDDSGAVIRPQGGITEQDWITSTAVIPGQDFTKSDYS